MRKGEIRTEVEGKFAKLIEEIKNLEESLYIELNKAFSQIYKETVAMLEQENKIEV